MVTFSAMLLDLRHEFVEQLRMCAGVDLAFDQLAGAGHGQPRHLLAQFIPRRLDLQRHLGLGGTDDPRALRGRGALGRPR